MRADPAQQPLPPHAGEGAPKGRMGERGLRPRKRARNNARALRQNMPFAERLLWSKLRGRREDGLKFRRQHPEAPYIIDFVELTLKLAIELDGLSHIEVKDVRRDKRRAAYLEAKGWTIIRFENAYSAEAVNGIVSEIVHFAERLRASRALPHRASRVAAVPLPPQAGEGAT